MSATLNPRLILKILCVVIGSLILLQGIMIVAEYGFGKPGFLELRALFDMNREQNIPTLFSTLQLVACSMLLLIAGLYTRRSKAGNGVYWFCLAAVFAFLGGDEFCQWHENLVGPVRDALHTTGSLSFAWVIPYAAGTALFAAGFARFWWKLPPRTKTLFAVAGVIYVGSGIGLEMVGSKLFTLYGWASAQFDTEVMVEEGGEMFGVALFLYAILEYLCERMEVIHLVLKSRHASAADALVEDARYAEHLATEVERRRDVA
jgi:hypothetical protein